MLEVSDIHLIQTITEYGSINKASEQLHISQPTLSKRLGRLEHVLNISLFHRHNGGMIPTDAAKYVMNSGERLKSQIQTIERHVELMANLESGQLNLGVGPIIEQLYFPKVLLDFTEESKNIRFNLRTEAPDRLLRLLLCGQIDVGIGPFDLDALPTELLVTPVQSKKVVLVVRKGHPILEKNNSPTPEQILQFPTIGPNIPAHFEKWLDMLHLSNVPLISCDNYATSKSVAMSSNYITGGPEVLFRKELRSGELVSLESQVDVQWSAYCVTRPESMLIPAVKLLIDIVNRYADVEL